MPSAAARWHLRPCLWREKSPVVTIQASNACTRARGESHNTRDEHAPSEQLLDDYHFTRYASCLITVARGVVQMRLQLQPYSCVHGRLMVFMAPPRLLSGWSSVQTKEDSSGQRLFTTDRHASELSHDPMLTSDTRRLPSPFMALCRTSASALESKFPKGFTLPLLACGTDRARLFIYQVFSHHILSSHRNPCS